MGAYRDEGGCTGCEKLAREINKEHLEKAYKMGMEFKKLIKYLILYHGNYQGQRIRG